MNERSHDFEQLQRFTRAGEQSAFGDVVRRHLDLVFATALRKVEDTSAAQEVAQNVFASLARVLSPLGGGEGARSAGEGGNLGYRAQGAHKVRGVLSWVEGIQLSKPMAV